MTGAVGLKCKIGPGMFPTEYSVEMKTAHGKTVSFFASHDKVRKDRQLLVVEPLDRGDEVVLVWLPGYPLESPSRYLNVKAADVVDL